MEWLELNWYQYTVILVAILILVAVIRWVTNKSSGIDKVLSWNETVRAFALLNLSFMTILQALTHVQYQNFLIGIWAIPLIGSDGVEALKFTVLSKTKKSSQLSNQIPSEPTVNDQAYK